MGSVGVGVASGKRRYAGCPLGEAKLNKMRFPPHKATVWLGGSWRGYWRGGRRTTRD